MPPIILASASPRRHELLALGGIEFRVQPASATEIPTPHEQPEQFVRRMSDTKARLAAERAAPADLVLAADTIVVLDGEILNKPDDPAHAVAMLGRLRGRTHLVYTSLAALDLASGRLHQDLVSSRVPMRNYSDQEIDAYVATGNPLDKAGGYAIQFGGFQPVDLARFEDCFANVMGLPVCRALALLRQARPALVAADMPLGDCQCFRPDECPVVHRINKDNL
jgi:septum formation protein